MVDWSGPTLPAGHTSSPGTRWHPVHGPLSRLRKSARPFRGSPVTAAGSVTRATGGPAGGAGLGYGLEVEARVGPAPYRIPARFPLGRLLGSPPGSGIVPAG